MPKAKSPPWQFRVSSARASGIQDSDSEGVHPPRPTLKLPVHPRRVPLSEWGVSILYLPVALLIACACKLDMDQHRKRSVYGAVGLGGKERLPAHAPEVAPVRYWARPSDESVSLVSWAYY